jgi:hypothetical protein
MTKKPAKKAQSNSNHTALSVVQRASGAKLKSAGKGGRSSAKPAQSSKKKSSKR